MNTEYTLDGPVLSAALLTAVATTTCKYEAALVNSRGKHSNEFEFLLRSSVGCDEIRRATEQRKVAFLRVPKPRISSLVLWKFDQHLILRIGH